MSEEDGMDDWAAAMAEQADAEEGEAEGEGGDSPDLGANEIDVQVAELDELEDEPITNEQKKKLDQKSVV